MGDGSFVRSTPLGLGSAGVAASTRVGLTDRKASLGVFGAIFGGVLGGSIPTHSLEPHSQMLPLQLPLQESWASQLASSEESSEQLASPSSSAEVALVPSVVFSVVEPEEGALAPRLLRGSSANGRI